MIKSNLNIGFTGTKEGMTKEQMESFAMIIEGVYTDHPGGIFHHGDCMGADAQAHDVTRMFSQFKIKIHPPNIKKYRAFCRGDEIAEEKDYLVRNKDIVAECDVLIATPKEHEEQIRSGTWATIRYGRKAGRKVVIILPDGKCLIE